MQINFGRIQIFRNMRALKLFLKKLREVRDFKIFQNDHHSSILYFRLLIFLKYSIFQLIYVLFWMLIIFEKVLI